MGMDISRYAKYASKAEMPTKANFKQNLNVVGLAQDTTYVSESTAQLFDME
jgi:hypothetical protein